MMTLRNRLLHAAALSGFVALAGISATVLAQPETGARAPVSGLQFAQASSVLQDIQRELNQLGYDAGTPDGLMGARTRWAIQAYQRERGLSEDGQPTAALLSHIRATARGVQPSEGQAQPPSQQLVSDTQEALQALGYRVGRVSGRLTDDTRSAIRNYQSAHGLRVSGEPSHELLRHMRGRLDPAEGAAEVESDTIAQIQAELRLRGYPIPQVSGHMDAPTRAAIREYQQGQGVMVTGMPSAMLRDELLAASAQPVAVAALTIEQRAAAQRALNERGYDAGPPDGVLGPRSRNSIQRFQSDHNLRATGELTPRTMELLGLSAAAAQPSAQPVGQYRTRIRDDFSDGDYTHNPAWTINSGDFTVRKGGLNSSMTPAVEGPEEMGRRMLGDLLGKQLGFELPGQAAAVASAYLPTSIPPAFRITMVLSGSAESFSHIDVGPYRGQALNSGYRLIHRANQQQPLQLVSVGPNGESVIASTSARLDSGAPQRLVWLRESNGRMLVTRNGEVLIDVVDPAPGGAFDGFSLINVGGDWTLQELSVEERR